jgi:hypothetical protein
MPNRFGKTMKFAGIAMVPLLLWNTSLRAAEEPRLLAKVTPLPVALDPDFQFRKTKIFSLTERGTVIKLKAGKRSQPGTNAAAASRSGSVVQEASITFERQYRLFGAVTNVDRHQRYGDYFDFFWRAKRPADLSVRLEYRQEKLHAHVQAQEIFYPNARGSHKSEFRVIGDDFTDGGAVMAWRCLMVQDGRVVAETHSFLWD